MFMSLSGLNSYFEPPTPGSTFSLHNIPAEGHLDLMHPNHCYYLNVSLAFATYLSDRALRQCSDSLFIIEIKYLNSDLFS